MAYSVEFEDNLEENISIFCILFEKGRAQFNCTYFKYSFFKKFVFAGNEPTPTAVKAFEQPRNRTTTACNRVLFYLCVFVFKSLFNSSPKPSQKLSLRKYSSGSKFQVLSDPVFATSFEATQASSKTIITSSA